MKIFRLAEVPKTKPIQTQFFALFILPMLPIYPNQTQPVVSLPALSKVEVSNLFQTTPACRGEASGEAGSLQFHNSCPP